MLFAKTIFLRNTREAERLAWEAAAEDVERGDVGDGDGVDVAGGFLAEIGGVGLARKLVPVTGEDAFCAGALEGQARAAYAREEVDEAKLAGLLRAVLRGDWAWWALPLLGGLDDLPPRARTNFTN